MNKLTCPVCDCTEGIMCTDTALVNYLQLEDLCSVWTVKDIRIRSTFRCPSGHTWCLTVPYPGAV